MNVGIFGMQQRPLVPVQAWRSAWVDLSGAVNQVVGTAAPSGLTPLAVGGQYKHKIATNGYLVGDVVMARQMVGFGAGSRVYDAAYRAQLHKVHTLNGSFPYFLHKTTGAANTTVGPGECQVASTGIVPLIGIPGLTAAALEIRRLGPFPLITGPRYFANPLPAGRLPLFMQPVARCVIPEGGYVTGEMVIADFFIPTSAEGGSALCGYEKNGRCFIVTNSSPRLIDTSDVLFTMTPGNWQHYVIVIG